jgi:hypothetical protein
MALQTIVMTTDGDGGVSDGAKVTFQYNDATQKITQLIVTVAGLRADGNPKNLHIDASDPSTGFDFHKDYPANPDGSSRTYTDAVPAGAASMYTLTTWKGAVTIDPASSTFTWQAFFS